MSGTWSGSRAAGVAGLAAVEALLLLVVAEVGGRVVGHARVRGEPGRAFGEVDGDDLDERVDGPGRFARDDARVQLRLEIS